MRDEEYIYQMTNRERARYSRGARSRKRGSKSKKCSLPSDNMTAAQLRKENGELITYNLKKPMSWEKFKSLPDNVKKQYITGLVDTYGVNASGICKMFGVDVSGFLKRMRCIYTTDYPFKSGRTKYDVERWNEFLASEKPSEEPTTEAIKEPVVEENIVETLPAVVKNEVKPMFSVEHGEVTIKGQPNAALAKFLLLLETDAEYTFMITFRKELTFKECEANS